MRRAGATKLGENNRWGNFPSFGLGVDLNKYLQLDNVDLLKVRLGYGVTGSLPSEFGLAQSGYGPSGNLLSSVPNRQPNPDLKWEEKAETNLGFEFNAGRLSATLDLYTRKVSDFILGQKIDPADLPPDTIFISDYQIRNSGQLTTKGFELGLNYDIVKRDDFTYNSGIILSSNIKR